MNKITIIGWGNQAKSWALNLRDSGVEVTIALRASSSSIEHAQSLGLKVTELSSEEIQEHLYFVMLTPDHTHREILASTKFHPSATFVYAHGYSYVYSDLKTLSKTWTHLLLAPKAIASELRFAYETKGKLGAVMAYETEDEKLFIIELAEKLGITAGPFQSSFEEETNADLFSEQALLCSMIPYGALACYQKLREKNISKEAAYFECWHEMKLIIDALLKVGPDRFFDLISPNALLGAHKTKDFFASNEFQTFLNEIWDDIQTGNFESFVQKSALNEIRNEIKTFWSEQELSQHYYAIKDDLYQDTL